MSGISYGQTRRWLCCSALDATEILILGIRSPSRRDISQQRSSQAGVINRVVGISPAARLPREFKLLGFWNSAEARISIPCNRPRTASSCKSHAPSAMLARMLCGIGLSDEPQVKISVINPNHPVFQNRLNLRPDQRPGVGVRDHVVRNFVHRADLADYWLAGFTSFVIKRVPVQAHNANFDDHIRRPVPVVSVSKNRVERGDLSGALITLG